MVRYSVVPVDIEEIHPYLANKRVYKIFDAKTQLLSLGCYIKEHIAQEVADRKNAGR